MFFLPLFSIGQLTLDQEHQIDSLKQVIHNAEHDTTVVNAWMNWSVINANSDKELNIRLNQKIDSLCALNLSKNLLNTTRSAFLKAQAFSLKQLGIVEYYNENYANAIELFIKAVKVNGELNDKKGTAVCYIYLGTIHQNQSNYVNAINAYHKCLEISTEQKDTAIMNMCFHNIGIVHYKQGNYKKAIELYELSLRIEEKSNNKKGMADSFNNIGNVYRRQGDYEKAIELYSKSLKYREEIDFKPGISSSYSSLGLVQLDQKNYLEAIQLFRQSLEIEEELGNTNAMANCYNNIGVAQKKLGNYETAIELYYKALDIREKLGDKSRIAKALNNIALIYLDQQNYSEALELLSKSLEIRKAIGDKNGVAGSHNNLGLVYFEKGDYKEALENGMIGMDIAKNLGEIISIRDASKLLWKTHKKLRNYKESLKMYSQFIQMRDSIESEENQKAIIRQEYKYQYEKQAAADSVKNAEAKKVSEALLAAEKAENERKKSQIQQGKLERKQQDQQAYFLYGVLALAVLFGIFIFNRFRVTKKQRDIIDEQKSVVESQKAVVEEQKSKVDEAYEQLEEKNTEILDSINYAKRIQSAILPPEKLVKECLQNSFVLYKPKDIVAGDFYWMEPVGDSILFAAADCTGHGVPGAMVSVVCNNGLNRSVREYGLIEPGDILSKTREIVISEFEKSEEEVKDGMDVALCSLEGRTLKYAGAHNPLWIIRKDSAQVEEVKAHKQPIGKYGESTPYPTHIVELSEGDTFYIFSDGYADQFGGEKGKKFKTANFKRLLLSIQNETIERQRELIDEGFENWKGSIEQLDDVCVIGVRV